MHLASSVARTALVNSLSGPLAFVAFILASASLGAQAAGGVTVRDSSGIRIVESRSPLWAAGSGWGFASTPTVEIGAADGDTTLLLNNTQFATRLSDGRIVIAQEYNLKVFSPSGRFLSTIGRRGRGPGEFAYGISGLASLPGDTLAVNQATGVMLFDSQGRFARLISTRVEGLVRDHQTEGASLLADASALLALYDPEPESWREGAIRPRVGYVRIAEGTSRADTAGFFPGFEQVVVVGGTRPQIQMHPLPRDTYVATGGDRVYIGDNGVYEIRGFTLAPRGAGRTASGPMRLTHLIRRVKAPVPYTTSDRDAYIARVRSSIESAPADRRQARSVALERLLAVVEWPRHRPAWAGIRADRDGNLWVAETRPPGSPLVWSVFDRSGRFLGELTSPPNVAMIEIGSDYMLGIWRNEDDVEFLRVYRLIKG